MSHIILYTHENKEMETFEIEIPREIIANEQIFYNKAVCDDFSLFLRFQAIQKAFFYLFSKYIETNSAQLGIPPYIVCFCVFF